MTNVCVLQFAMNYARNAVDFQTLQLKENGTHLPLHAGLQQPVSCTAEAILSKQVEDDKLIESLKSMLPSFAS